jgi:adenylate cyclase
MTDSRSYISAIKPLWNWWFAMPPHITPARRRFYTTIAVGIPPSWSIHFVYIFLFAYWGVWPLAIANVFSVLLWTISAVLWRQRRLVSAYTVISLEIAIHAALVIYYVGSGFGVQYFLFALLINGLLASWWPRWINLSLVALYALLFILLYYYAQLYPPLVSVPPLQLAVINVINVVTVFGIIAAVTRYFISVAEGAEAALEIEHAKSEALLNNVLPTAIAARLKQESATIADGFSSASILFADIAGFTPLSQQVSPKRLVDMLNAIFSRFDELVDEYGLEKIKTIGDAYMVASGIPTPREDHAEALALFALAMRDTLADYNRTAHADLQLRIGISSGPVIAGVIGKRRFLYDLWGDSVNTASRMESHGVPGQIQISETTRQLLSDRFTFLDRGVIEVKGKGPMHTYFLRGSNDPNT